MKVSPIDSSAHCAFLSYFWRFFDPENVFKKCPQKLKRRCCPTLFTHTRTLKSNFCSYFSLSFDKKRFPKFFQKIISPLILSVACKRFRTCMCASFPPLHSKSAILDTKKNEIRKVQKKIRPMRGREKVLFFSRHTPLTRRDTQTYTHADTHKHTYTNAQCAHVHNDIHPPRCFSGGWKLSKKTTQSSANCESWPEGLCPCHHLKKDTKDVWTTVESVSSLSLILGKVYALLDKLSARWKPPFSNIKQVSAEAGHYRPHSAKSSSTPLNSILQLTAASRPSTSALPSLRYRQPFHLWRMREHLGFPTNSNDFSKSFTPTSRDCQSIWPDINHLTSGTAFVKDWCSLQHLSVHRF
jgi:hypothetical protein